MTQDEVIKLAKKAGFGNYAYEAAGIFERFAAMVAAAEREKCTGTQEFVTLPREVVELAIEAIGDAKHKIEFDAIDALIAALKQPPTTEQSSAVVEECLTDELKPRFSAHDDAERLKSVARGMSYNDHGEAIWKHTLMEIAVRLESGGYAAPQPPALEQQVEKESTCKDYLQVEQEPVAWLKTWNSVGHARTGMQRLDLTPECETWLANMFPTITPLYTHPQPKREPLTDEQRRQIWRDSPFRGSGGQIDWFIEGTKAAERAHNIK